MADPFSKEKRSQIMASIRSKNTAPEKVLFLKVRSLYTLGLRYRKHYKKLPGKPDLVFLKQKVAVFIDSEFWHGKDFHLRVTRLPAVYWREKIKGNIERDKKANKALKDAGWTVMRFWSREFVKQPDYFIDKIKEELRKKL